MTCSLSIPSVLIEVGYEFMVYTTAEQDESVTLCAVILNSPDGSPRPFTLSATTEDGEAGKSIY